MEHLSTLNALCSVLGVDFKETVREIHPSLDESEVPKSVSNATIERLSIAIGRLREIKVERMQKVIDATENDNPYLTCAIIHIATLIYGSFKILPLQCWNCGILWIHQLKSNDCFRM